MGVDESISNLSIINQNCVEANLSPEWILTTHEVKTMDMKAIRRLAAECPSDEVHGKSTKLEMQRFFAGQRIIPVYL